MTTGASFRIEPQAETLAAAREWLEPVRNALGSDFLACYLTGSVLRQGFDPRHSRINLLVVARELPIAKLDAVSQALPAPGKQFRFDPLFLTQSQVTQSLDVFPIEWLEIQESHLRLEGQDVLQSLEVPLTYLRLQCEHDLRGKLVQLRQAYLMESGRPAVLLEVLRGVASSFATLFRTLLRLRGESPPAETPQVVQRVSDVYGLQAEGLLGAYLVRYGERKFRTDEILPIYRKFLTEIDHLAQVINELRLG